LVVAVSYDASLPVESSERTATRAPSEILSQLENRGRALDEIHCIASGARYGHSPRCVCLPLCRQRLGSFRYPIPVWSNNPICMKSKDDSGIRPGDLDWEVTPRYITRKSPCNVGMASWRTSRTMSRVFSEIEFLDHTPTVPWHPCVHHLNSDRSGFRTLGRTGATSALLVERTVQVRGDVPFALQVCHPGGRDSAERH